MEEYIPSNTNIDWEEIRHDPKSVDTLYPLIEVSHPHIEKQWTDSEKRIISRFLNS